MAPKVGTIHRFPTAQSRSFWKLGAPGTPGLLGRASAGRLWPSLVGNPSAVQNPDRRQRWGNPDPWEDLKIRSPIQTHSNPYIILK